MKKLDEAGLAIMPKSLTSDLNALGQQIMETGMRNVIGEPLPTLRNIYSAMVAKFNNGEPVG